MTQKAPEFQPGVMLYDAIMAAFRANGATLGAWCREQNVTVTRARNTAFGQARGGDNDELLRRMIEAAGREVVTVVYHKRMREHLADLKRGAA